MVKLGLCDVGCGSNWGEHDLTDDRQSSKWSLRHRSCWLHEITLVRLEALAECWEIGILGFFSSSSINQCYFIFIDGFI